MDNKNENLKNFFNEEQIKEFEDDLRFVGNSLFSADKPTPSSQLINDIKSLQTHRQRTHKLYYTLEAVAAMILIVLALNIIFTSQSQYQTKLSAGIWQSNDLAQDDTEIYALNSELEYIESEFISTSTSANGELSDYISEFELKVNENGTDFWKG